MFCPLQSSCISHRFDLWKEASSLPGTRPSQGPSLCCRLLQRIFFTFSQRLCLKCSKDHAHIRAHDTALWRRAGEVFYRWGNQGTVDLYKSFTGKPAAELGIQSRNVEFKNSLASPLPPCHSQPRNAGFKGPPPLSPS